MKEQLLDGLSNYEITANCAIIGIVGLFAIWAAIRGVAHIMWAMVSLGVGGVAGYWAFRNAPRLMEGLVEDPDFYATLGLCSLIGGVFWVITRALGKMIVIPLLMKGPWKALLIGMPGALISLIPSAILIWVVALLVRFGGTVEELKYADQSMQEVEGKTQAVPGKAPFMARAKNALSNSFLGPVLERLDPFLKESERSIAALLVSARESGALEELDKKGETAAILANRRIRDLLANEKVKRHTENADYWLLLTDREVKDAARDSTVETSLDSFDVEDTYEEVRKARRVHWWEEHKRKTGEYAPGE